MPLGRLWWQRGGRKRRQTLREQPCCRQPRTAPRPLVREFNCKIGVCCMAQRLCPGGGIQACFPPERASVSAAFRGGRAQGLLRCSALPRRRTPDGLSSRGHGRRRDGRCRHGEGAVGCRGGREHGRGDEAAGGGRPGELGRSGEHRRLHGWSWGHRGSWRVGGGARGRLVPASLGRCMVRPRSLGKRRS